MSNSKSSVHVTPEKTTPLSYDAFSNSFSALDLLASAILILDHNWHIIYANAAAENLSARSRRALLGNPLENIFDLSQKLTDAFNNALDNNWSYTGQNIKIHRGDGGITRINCTVTPLLDEQITANLPKINSTAKLLLELQPIDKQLQVNREERLVEQQEAHRELVRNLAHEIRNPLSGIRGAAQLLEQELNTSEHIEYTQVIVKETDRLQDLMQRLLSPHQGMRPAPVNIHEILEHVRSLIAAEFSEVLCLKTDYDTSLPNLIADREQLVQALLNVVRNAAQATIQNPPNESMPCVILRTRVIRQITLAKRYFRLAVEIQIEDNGPGIPESIIERMFYPLVSGSPNGTGLGLSITQTFIQQHQGIIECETQTGQTIFRIRLPIQSNTDPAQDTYSSQ